MTVSLAGRGMLWCIAGPFEVEGNDSYRVGNGHQLLPERRQGVDGGLFAAGLRGPADDAGVFEAPQTVGEGHGVGARYGTTELIESQFPILQGHHDRQGPEIAERAEDAHALFDLRIRPGFLHGINDARALIGKLS
jgi:hypothetical protein